MLDWYPSGGIIFGGGRGGMPGGGVEFFLTDGIFLTSGMFLPGGGVEFLFFVGGG